MLADHRPPPTTPPGEAGGSGGSGGDAQGLRIVPGRGELILIVDDDENLRNALVRMLKSLGLEVVQATNGQECLEQFRTSFVGREREVAEALALLESSRAPIDALLVDVVMPQLGGPELVERLASRGIHPAVIYMTGYDDPAHLARVPESPPTPLLKKPFTLHALVLVLRDILDRPPLPRHGL